MGISPLSSSPPPSPKNEKKPTQTPSDGTVIWLIKPPRQRPPIPSLWMPSSSEACSSSTGEQLPSPQTHIPENFYSPRRKKTKKCCKGTWCRIVGCMILFLLVVLFFMLVMGNDHPDLVEGNSTSNNTTHSNTTSP
ncbi:hypothetical protein HAT2_00646 [Candidatus Similichlamydia laticola]|uniref:Uncharacterized protein n=1 Tax=Candidatus Similichlamydia laticola TaxID=2170265 RepID=A0A369K9I7_9BACT|nr:hypothetical protein HAT2_00646 [Candidatus Similichlamydia laticola]